MSSDEIERVKDEFIRLGKDNVIGKKKLFEYFRMSEMQGTQIANELFQMIKNSSLITRPINFEMFLNFISIVNKGTKDEKL